MIDLDITELFEEIVKELPEGLEILYPNGKGGTKVMKSPRLNYIFGSSQYIKDILDEYSKSSAQSERKFPLVYRKNIFPSDNHKGLIPQCECNY